MLILRAVLIKNWQSHQHLLCILRRDIAACAAEFQSRQLPLHGLINNIGVENPQDTKSKEGFDVSCT